tara:strand:+ start:200 stop:496 length:297 start_codon:yes stop_codon:yes gene_type:complete
MAKGQASSMEFDFTSEEWLRAIDESFYATNEWEDAAKSLWRKLSDDGLQASFMQITEYLSCCAQSVANSYPKPNLADVAAEFYVSHGMEQAIPEKKQR